MPATGRRIAVVAAAAVTVALGAAVCGRPAAGGKRMSEAEILAGADARIEQHRKAEAVVQVVDGAGNPVAGARVQAEQVRHGFLFGCNAFPVLGFQDPKQEETYQREFTALLNYATLEFYWGSYERRPGKTLAARVKRQAQWCREHGIATKGHPLVWHEVYPTWGPTEAEEAREQSRARVKEIVSSFAGLVDRWDVVNEATVSADFDNGVGRWVKRDGAAAVVGEALEVARAANARATLLYNDYDVGRKCEKLIEDLLAAKRPLDAIGIQSHMHGGEWELRNVWEVCERLSRFGRPLHFTELTVVSGEHGWERRPPWPTTPEGEARQAEYVAKLYTLLFSHPAVEAITWWDLQDGVWQGAPAGLVRADLTPKPAYERLLKLVKGEWWTRAEVETDGKGEARFRGFLGRYRVTVTTPSGRLTREMDLARSGANGVRVVVGR